jgi:DNA-dependent RNA polymerase auxiliary subunit epsilon
VKDKKPNSLLDLDAVLSTASGRRFVWRMIAPLDTDPMRGDTNSTYFNLGTQAAARGLLQEIQTQHFHWYQLMLNERYGENEETSCKSNDGE